MLVDEQSQELLHSKLILQTCWIANFSPGINRSIDWWLNYQVSKRRQLLDLVLQQSFVPREEFLGRPLGVFGGHFGGPKADLQ